MPAIPAAMATFLEKSVSFIKNYRSLPGDVSATGWRRSSVFERRFLSQKTIHGYWQNSINT